MCAHPSLMRNESLYERLTRTGVRARHRTRWFIQMEENDIQAKSQQMKWIVVRAATAAAAALKCWSVIACDYRNLTMKLIKHFTLRCISLDRSCGHASTDVSVCLLTWFRDVWLMKSVHTLSTAVYAWSMPLPFMKRKSDRRDRFAFVISQARSTDIAPDGDRIRAILPYWFIL